MAGQGSVNPQGGLHYTWAADELPHLLGGEYEFQDTGVPTDAGVTPVKSGMMITARAVLNDTGNALLPGEIFSWDASYVGTGAGAKNDAKLPGAGVVPIHVGSAGVADGKVFWAITKGPATVVHAGSTTIVANGPLQSAASGRVILYDITATSTVELYGLVGRALETPADDNAGTKFRALVDFRF